MEPIYNISEDAVYEMEIRALQDIDSSSATQTFNPLFEKMLNNTHAVKMEVEAMGDKVLWKQYRSLADLGLTDTEIVTSGTLATIVEAMDEYSVLSIDVAIKTATWNDLLPLNQGLFTIKKVYYSRVFLYFEGATSDVSYNEKYFAIYNQNNYIGFTNKISPWKRIITDNEVKWKQYTSLSELGLTDAEIVSSGTLATICKKLTAYSMVSLIVNGNTPWFNLVPSSSGILTIKRKGDDWRIYLNFEKSTSIQHGLWYATYRPDGFVGHNDTVSVWHQISIEYRSLGELGLTDADIVASGTLATIVEAMPNNSFLRMSTTDTVAWHKDLIGVYAGYGTLEITRIDINRVHLYFARSSNNAIEDLRYYCQYRPNPISGYTLKISPWKRIATSEDIEALKKYIDGIN